MRSAPALLAAAALLLAPSPGPGAAAADAAAESAAAENAAGVALHQEGRHEEAIERFRAAVAADPGAPLPRRNLAAALAAAAQRHLGAGRLEDADASLREALTLEPASPDLNVMLAVLRLARGDLYEARRAAERAVDLAPADGAALEVLGDVEYRDGRLSGARRAWEAARAAAPGRAAALDAKLARLALEAEAERSFGRDVSRHFTVQYDGTVPPEVARTALRLLEEAYDRLVRAFGRAPRHDIPVILTSRVLFASVTGTAAWVGGAYDGKIRVPVGGLDPGRDAARLAPILAHELTHAFLRANAAVPLPLWFEEGLAEHFAGEAAGGGAPPRTAPAAFPGLDAIDASLRGGPRVGAAYAAAGDAVADLVRRDGLWLPRRIVELAAEGVRFPEAFRRASGERLEEFERRVAPRP